MQLNLPEQRTIPGIDTRLRPLRDWLGSLPYVDTEATTEHIIERLHNINHQPLTAAERLPLLAAFRHSYERLCDALRTLARQQDPLTRPRPLLLLTEFTEQMSFGYKYALRDTVDERQRWGRAKQLAEATNFAQGFLALLLLCRYHAYQPVADASWRELGDLVRFAETQGLGPTRDAGFPFSAGVVQAVAVYRTLAMLRLADPYRMNHGLLWEAYGYLSRKQDQLHLLNQFEGQMPTGVFGLSLDREPDQSRPAPVAGVDRTVWRWLDARELIQSAQIDLDRLLHGIHPRRLGFSGDLAGSDAIQLLGRMLGQWTRSPQRKSARLSNSAEVELSPGLDAAYFFLNNCIPFDPAQFAPGEDDDDYDFSISGHNIASARAQDFRLIRCPTRNRSGGGLSLYVGSPDSLNLRVGQLVLVNLENTPGELAGAGLLGIVRWLINQDGKGIEAGVQYVARSSMPAVLRATSGVQRPHQPALASELPLADGQALSVLIAPKGLYRERDVLELLHSGQTLQIRCLRLLEIGQGFDRFCYEILG